MLNNKQIVNTGYKLFFNCLFNCLLTAIVLLAIGCNLMQAQDLVGKSEIPDVSAHLIASVKKVPSNSSFKLAVKLHMPPNWHTYYKVSGDAGMPTKIVWHLPKDFKAGDLEWQKPNRFSDAGIVTYGYEDQTLIAATITTPTKLPQGKKLLFEADVKWLACKNICVPGKAHVQLTLPTSQISVTEPDHVADFATVGFTGDLPGQSINVLNENFKVQSTGNNSNEFLTYLLFAFIGGFILNFMPCVLPVISIKILSFVQQSTQAPAQVFKLGLAFSAGIISAFLALAGLIIALQQSGQSVGWGFQFQHPLFVTAMAVLILVLALSLFGLFYISPPATACAAIDKAACNEGLTGSFFKGILATVLSTPCTAPFLGAAVGFAFTQPNWVIISIFFIVGLGMAFPYLLLTANPKWLHFMPKPGDWMEKFKQFLGFILLATVFWLLHVLGAQVGYQKALYAATFLLIVSFSVWLVSNSTDLRSSTKHKYIAWAVALLIVGVSYRFCISVLNYPDTMPQPMAQQGEQKTKSGITWQPFSVDTLNSALSSGNIVFLDFTAEWCLTCKANEITVIDTKAVNQKLKDLHVVTMKADWTKQDPQITSLLHKFGRSGVPLYVIFPKGKATEPIVLPELITTHIVTAALDKAAAQ